MTDGDRDRDAAWLLARERGQPGTAVSEAKAERYAQLEVLIADLPATPIAPPAGWQDRMFVAIKEATPAESHGAGRAAAARTSETPRSRRRRLVFPVAITALAAALVIILMVRDPFKGGGMDPTPEGPLIAVVVEPGAANRGPPSIGDNLVVRAVIRGEGELRVYDDAGVEQARCAAPDRSCRVEPGRDRTTLVLTLHVRTAGALRAVVFSPALGTASSGMAADVAAAVRAGITLRTHEPVDFR